MHFLRPKARVFWLLSPGDASSLTENHHQQAGFLSLPLLPGLGECLEAREE
jgi:hypothetical protein